MLDAKTMAPQTGLAGLWDRSREAEQNGNTGMVFAAFTPTGAAALLRQPVDEFFNGVVGLHDVLDGSTELNRVHEQIGEAPNHSRRIQALENFLVQRATNAQLDVFVSAAVSKIEAAHGVVRIEHLARHVGLCQSALERRFRKVTGASPKQFASIVRIRHVVRLRAAGSDFSSIAIAAGYCDQSHFIKDFKQMTGLAPESFFQRKLSPWFDDVAHATLA